MPENAAPSALAHAPTGSASSYTGHEPTLPRPTASAVVGLQWGDEGKGKIVDFLADGHDAVVRYNGGANAGHSVVVKGERFALHLIPAGILHPGKTAVIANGVVLDPEKLLSELDGLHARGVDTSALIISGRAHVVMPYHKAEDEAREESLKRGRLLREASDHRIVDSQLTEQLPQRAAHAGTPEGQTPAGPTPAGLTPAGQGIATTRAAEIGTTRRGIGPCYAEKAHRAAAIRVSDLLRPDILEEKITVACATKAPLIKDLPGAAAALDIPALVATARSWGERIAPKIRDTAYLLNGMIESGKKILFESANGTLLDVDHGTYPFVTGSSVCVSGVGPGAGVPVQRIGSVLGVMKAYSTRVGSGPMPTELMGQGEAGQIADRIRQRGREFGTTTGRPRRVGWLDLVAVKYSAMINGATGIALTMLDVLAGFDTIQVCTAYRIDGATTDHFIPDAFDLSRVEPVYQTLPGFAQEPSTCRTRASLPDNARRYMGFIEDFLGLPAKIVSVGPDRVQSIMQ